MGFFDKYIIKIGWIENDFVLSRIIRLIDVNFVNERSIKMEILIKYYMFYRCNRMYIIYHCSYIRSRANHYDLCIKYI